MICLVSAKHYPITVGPAWGQSTLFWGGVLKYSKLSWGEQEHTRYQSSTALLNYYSLGRANTQYAVKELMLLFFVTNWDDMEKLGTTFSRTVLV